MEAPDHDSRETATRGLLRHEVADAALVDAAPVVGDQHVSGLRVLDRFEEHVDAADVTGRQHATDESHARRQRLDLRGRAPHFDSGPQAGIGKVGSGQLGETRGDIGHQILFSNQWWA